jgi:hypothetical protein
MSSNVMGRGQKPNLARVLLCVGVLAAAGCAAEEAGVEAEGIAEEQAQIGGVIRNPNSPGVTRNPPPGTSQPVTPPPFTPPVGSPPFTPPIGSPPFTPPIGSPATPSYPGNPSSAGIVAPIKRCTALGNLELATCQQRWEDLPSGRAILDLGTGFSDVHFKLVGAGNRQAVIQGDIVIGDESSIRAADQFADVEAAARISTGLLWTNGRIPYEIDAAVSDPSRVTRAIAAWEAVTGVRFFRRTNETDYARIVDGAGCSSYVGRIGGVQAVTLNAGCSVGNTIHELGHLIGLWHEQSRLDRDKFIQIHLENIVDANEHNFDTIAGKPGSGDVNAYNFASIMHYPLNAFAVDATKPTISVRPGVTVPAGIVIGQRSTLSNGDITSINLIYCYAFGGTTLCR